MYNNIPKFLTDLNIWMCYDDRDKPSYKKLSDRVINQKKKTARDLTGKLVGKNHKTYSFNECLESIKNGFNSGIGIVLKNGIGCIDYDKIIKSVEIDKEYGFKKVYFKDDVSERITRDINLMNSYTEISPSGKGIHIYFLTNANITKRTSEIEIYTNQFIRVSGDVYNDVMFTDFEDRTSELETLLKYYKFTSIKKTKNGITSIDVINMDSTEYKKGLKKLSILFNDLTNKYDDADNLKKMFRGVKGTYLKKLYNNDLSDEDYLNYKKKYKTYTFFRDVGKIRISKEYLDKLNEDAVDTTNSGKAFTLIMYLIYYCYGDLKAVKRIFKSSALCKPDYLKCNYGKDLKYDKIDYLFIPKAVYYFNIYN